MIKKIIIVILLSFSFYSLVFAEGKPLEVQYPIIDGSAPTTTAISIANYAKYVFEFIIYLFGVIAIITLIYGGIRYLISAGKPETQ